MTFVLLVCGSRDWSDAEVIRNALKDATEEWGVTHLAHGDARGADKLAASICNDPASDFSRHIGVRGFPAHWNQQGRAAGVLRNQRMLEVANPDACLAFSAVPITRGTQDMVNRCLRAGVPTFLVTPDGTRNQLDLEA